MVDKKNNSGITKAGKGERLEMPGRPEGADISRIPFLERLIFEHRRTLLVLFGVITLILGYQATALRPDASFEKMIPTTHPYIANYLDNKEDLPGLGNAVRIAVETTEGDIFNAQYLETLQKINDDIFFIPGVDKDSIRSLWTANTRWLEVTEEGFDGGPVIQDDYDGSPQSLQQVRINVLKSGKVGTLVAGNFKSSIVFAPLVDVDLDTGKPLNYQKFSTDLETLIRDKYQTETIKIHITGFAKVVGDLIDGAGKIILFFLAATVITMIMLFGYSRCLKSTMIPIGCSIIAVVWQLGLMKTLGYGLDPYSMLVPFLIFAIGVSHGVQFINMIFSETAEGADKVQAARTAFRNLHKPGLTALVTDGIGFATLAVINITVIQDLAMGASMGVALLILTNLALLPVLMSYAGISPRRAESLKKSKADGDSGTGHPVWNLLSKLADKKAAPVTVGLVLCAFVWGIYNGQDVKIGDLDPGAPELRPDSRYNLDNQFMTDNYSASSDIFVIMVKTASAENSEFKTLQAMDRLQWELEHLPGVQSTKSLVNATRQLMAGLNEGNLKWMDLTRNKRTLDFTVTKAPPETTTPDGSLTPILVYLKDHKAETLRQVVHLVETFKAENKLEKAQFLLAAGNAGIEASTNIAIDKAQYVMLIWVYAVVIILCLLTFRSPGALLCIIVPLALTSVLCRVVMIQLDIGVKVATLPVIALGVGVGVDYGIYIFSRFQQYLHDGLTLRPAYYNTLKTTGKAVIFTGLTLSMGVVTWILSPIKFQADMGGLLTFMFFVNMVGAIVILPAVYAGFLLLTESNGRKRQKSVSKNNLKTICNNNLSLH